MKIFGMKRGKQTVKKGIWYIGGKKEKTKNKKAVRFHLDQSLH